MNARCWVSMDEAAHAAADDGEALEATEAARAVSLKAEFLAGFAAPLTAEVPYEFEGRERSQSWLNEFFGIAMAPELERELLALVAIDHPAAAAFREACAATYARGHAAELAGVDVRGRA